MVIGVEQNHPIYTFSNIKINVIKRLKNGGNLARCGYSTRCVVVVVGNFYCGYFTRPDEKSGMIRTQYYLVFQKRRKL